MIDETEEENNETDSQSFFSVFLLPKDYLMVNCYYIIIGSVQ